MNTILQQALKSAGKVVAAATLAAGGSAVHGQTPNYPDLKVIIPVADISIVQTQSGRQFQYTHDTFNAGSGPLEIQPVYNPASGNYQGYQHVYTLVSPGNWSLTQTIPIAGAFVFDSDHGHFHFPLVSFGLHTMTQTGGIGPAVAVSPKVGFCIGDSFIYDPNLPNAGAFGNWGDCADPTSIRGLSVGAVDEYDQTDEGQSIPIDGLPDGTYWFVVVADPNNFLTEGSKSNNETDVQLTITGNTVHVLKTVNPVLPQPPSLIVMSPANGATVNGVVNLTASTPLNGGSGVQYLIDGQPLGSPVTNSPYNLSWDTSTVPNGTHWIAAQITDSAGHIGTSPVVSVTVSTTTTGPPGPLSIDSSSFVDGHGSVNSSISTTAPGDLLLAFVAADGPLGSTQATTVTGGGLTWALSQRSNSQAGTSEIWTANAAGQLTGAAINSTLLKPGYDQSLSVVAFKGASGIGTSAIRSASSGAPQVGLTSTKAGSWTFGVGNDWDNAIARTTPQTILHQYSNNSTGDTFWVQSQNAPSSRVGMDASIFDTAPTTDRWNLAAVEVLPASQTPPDTTPPTVQMTNPAPGATVSGQITLAANASDNVGVVSVTFYVDNAQVGSPVTTPPYMTPWDTTTATAGQHTLTAIAKDGAGNAGTAAQVSVTVDNSHPPKVIGKDATVSVDGHGTMTTAKFSTATAGDTLIAFVAYDGPAGSPQTATVSGAGLTWHLLKRSNAQAGTAEIWWATASGPLSNATVASQSGAGASYHGSLTVIAFTNTTGPNIVGQASAPSGAPDVFLPGIAAGNWVFAVGNDWDNAAARTPVSGQVLVHQKIDTPVGDTYWVQSTKAPSTANALVDIHDNSPTTDRWNYAAVEIVAAP